MATLQLTVPELAQAMDLFLAERFPSLLEKEEISLVVSYRNEKLGVSFSGRLSGYKTELCAEGTITLEKNGHIFVYEGIWDRSILRCEKLLSDSVKIQGGNLVSYFSGEKVSYDLPENSVVENSFIRVRGSALQFAVRPDSDVTARVPGPDGEYLELDLGQSEGSFLQLGQDYTHTMSRTILGKNAAGELVEGFLEVWPEKARISWYTSDDFTLEVPIELAKFKAWFTQGKSHDGDRNLLRALGTEVPLLRKKSVVCSTSSAS